ncbi:hypothetical protein AT984_12240 [Paucibacter sp. KCTC 42545]|nr:hypothetical protein AT984_12240 [Paucibacter sp. KCTC 42545]
MRTQRPAAKRRGVFHARSSTHSHRWIPPGKARIQVLRQAADSAEVKKLMKISLAAPPERLWR